MRATTLGINDRTKRSPRLGYCIQKPERIFLEKQTRQNSIFEVVEINSRVHGRALSGKWLMRLSVLLIILLVVSLGINNHIESRDRFVFDPTSNQSIHAVLYSKGGGSVLAE